MGWNDDDQGDRPRKMKEEYTVSFLRVASKPDARFQIKSDTTYALQARAPGRLPSMSAHSDADSDSDSDADADADAGTHTVASTRKHRFAGCPGGQASKSGRTGWSRCPVYVVLVLN